MHFMTGLRAIESFAADVHHELKNPLTTRCASAVETLPLRANEGIPCQAAEMERNPARCPAV